MLPTITQLLIQHLAPFIEVGVGIKKADLCKRIDMAGGEVRDYVRYIVHEFVYCTAYRDEDGFVVLE